VIAVITCSIKSALNLIGGTAQSFDSEITVDIPMPSSVISEMKCSSFNMSDIG
jgi:hypothetical protein